VHGSSPWSPWQALCVALSGVGGYYSYIMHENAPLRVKEKR
jgi:hypothetical protein